MFDHFTSSSDAGGRFPAVVGPEHQSSVISTSYPGGLGTAGAMTLRALSRVVGAVAVAVVLAAFIGFARPAGAASQQSAVVHHAVRGHVDFSCTFNGQPDGGTLTNVTPGEPINVSCLPGAFFPGDAIEAIEASPLAVSTTIPISQLGNEQQVVGGKLAGGDGSLLYTFNLANPFTAADPTRHVHPYPARGLASFSIDNGFISYGVDLQFNPSVPPPPPPGYTGMASTPDGGGYWITNAAGAVFAHGDATSFGSMAGTHLNAPVNHIVSTPDGQGYWLVAADGGIFTFGDAGFMDPRAISASTHQVDVAPTADGGGYWLVASDGGIFSFGDAVFQGWMGSVHLNKPVVGIAPDYATGGYRSSRQTVGSSHSVHRSSEAPGRSI